MSLDAAPPPAVVWNPWLRAAASLAIGWHLVGVMVAPLSVPPRFEGQDSILGAKLKTVYLPYMTALYLNHAYKFFAPNPGDSHLVRYDLYFADGKKLVNRDDQIFPDRFHHWPRLLYHRHFMLTEFINDGAPPWVWDPPPENITAPPNAVTLQPPTPPLPTGEMIPVSGPPRVNPYVQAMAEYLACRHGASRVDVFYRKHSLPSIEDFNRVGRKLDSPESYRDRLLLSYTAEPKS